MKRLERIMKLKNPYKANEILQTVTPSRIEGETSGTLVLDNVEQHGGAAANIGPVSRYGIHDNTVQPTRGVVWLVESPIGEREIEASRRTRLVLENTAASDSLSINCSLNGERSGLVHKVVNKLLLLWIDDDDQMTTYTKISARGSCGGNIGNHDP